MEVIKDMLSTRLRPLTMPVPEKVSGIDQFCDNASTIVCNCLSGNIINFPGTCLACKVCEYISRWTEKERIKGSFRM